MRRYDKTKTAAGWVVEYADRFVLRHRFPKVCYAAWRWLNDDEEAICNG